MYIGGGYEDLEGEDDSKSEFICPFCADVFDIVGLCCHIDEEHPVEAKNGVILTIINQNPSFKMLAFSFVQMLHKNVGFYVLFFYF